jgi:hypothetical protein
MTQQTDIDFSKYLLETLAPDLREAGYTATADDVEEAGHRLLHAAEIVGCLTNDLHPPMSDKALKAYAKKQGLRQPLKMDQGKGGAS